MAQRKTFQFLPGGTSRIRNNAIEILTKMTPHMTTSECTYCHFANNWCWLGVILGGSVNADKRRAQARDTNLPWKVSSDRIRMIHLAHEAYKRCNGTEQSCHHDVIVGAVRLHHRRSNDKSRPTGDNSHGHHGARHSQYLGGIALCAILRIGW